jgi:hypothetical protein
MTEENVNPKASWKEVAIEAFKRPLSTGALSTSFGALNVVTGVLLQDPIMLFAGGTLVALAGGRFRRHIDKLRHPESTPS